MAVIPDNRDRELMVSAPGVDDFWNSVRSWQKRGWTVGLHGYQHRYLTAVAGRYGRMPRSEFAGLPYEIQELKLAGTSCSRAGKLSACRFSSYRIDSLRPHLFWIV